MSMYRMSNPLSAGWDAGTRHGTELELLKYRKIVANNKKITIK